MANQVPTRIPHSIGLYQNCNFACLKIYEYCFVKRATLGINNCTDASAVSKTNNGNGLIDEVIDLKMKLKEAQSLNEQLKISFKKNLNELQNTLGECVEDKEKLMLKK